MENKKILLVGYGTLLLQESLNDTVENNSKKKITPIIIKNYKRLFNLIPEHYEADNFVRTDGTEKGAANIEPTNGVQFNGLSFEVDANDLALLDKRERYYKRSIVSHYDFKTGENLGECNVYESQPDKPWIVRNSSHLLPLLRDVVYARIGAYRISKAFGEMYDATTYLADGKTLMIDYYKDYINKLEDLEFIRKKYKK